MKILFIRFASYFGEKNPHPENIMAPIEIGIISRIAEEMGHQTFLLDTEADLISTEELYGRIKNINPELIAIKAKTQSIKKMVEIF